MAKEASMKRRRAVGNAITYIVLVIISIIWLFPLFCLVVQSFRSYVTEFGGMVNYLLPKEFSLDSYKFLFSEECQFVKWYGNTLTIAAAVAVLHATTMMSAPFSSRCTAKL